MASESGYGPITSFLVQLAEDDDLLRTWLRHPRSALEGQGLSPGEEDLLVGGDVRELQKKVQDENAGREAQAFMLIFMR